MKLNPTSGALISTIAHSARLTTSSRTSFCKSSQVILSSRATTSRTRWRVRCRLGVGAASSERKKDLLQAAARKLGLGAQLIQGAHPDNPSGGQQQQAIAN